MTANDAVKQIRIVYYALLREERGCSEEELRTSAATPHELYDALRAQHGFSLEANQLKVALNDAFSTWDTPLKEGDAVVFIPPVAGG